MKLLEHFDALLKNTVNLNQTRIDLLEERVGAIQQFLYATEYGPIFQRFSAQGSWAHQTMDADRDESIRKWRRVFGDAFAKGETVDRATAVVARLAESFQRGQDLVAIVVAYGRAVLDRMPRILPHVEPSPYRLADRQIPVRLIAHEKKIKGGFRERTLQSGDLIKPASGIEFQAVQNNGLPFPKDEVRWQVVNTDKAAAADDCLRGDFYRSDTHGFRYEATKYRGVHWVQAFLVNKRTGLLDGVSERFFVVTG